MTVVKDEVKVIHIPHQRMVYELLEDTTREWSGYIDAGYRKFVIDMSKVTFMDSASIGCLMDFYRKTKNVGGRIHLAAVQPRIDTLLAIAKAKTLF
ncbi:MAG TPA: STAS domain-containing protein, partial [Acidobacteriota bacterium]|nr:STAS domain-containing protein [Acidobacteriota bacterium]